MTIDVYSLHCILKVKAFHVVLLEYALLLNMMITPIKKFFLRFSTVPLVCDCYFSTPSKEQDINYLNHRQLIWKFRYVGKIELFQEYVLILMYIFLKSSI